MKLAEIADLKQQLRDVIEDAREAGMADWQIAVALQGAIDNL